VWKVAVAAINGVSAFRAMIPAGCGISMGGNKSGAQLIEWS